MKLTPKQEQAIDGIIGESHQGFFVYLGRLLGKQTATTKEEKHEKHPRLQPRGGRRVAPQRCQALHHQWKRRHHAGVGSHGGGK